MKRIVTYCRTAIWRANCDTLQLRSGDLPQCLSFPCLADDLLFGHCAIMWSRSAARPNTALSVEKQTPQLWRNATVRRRRTHAQCTQTRHAHHMRCVHAHTNALHARTKHSTQPRIQLKQITKHVRNPKSIMSKTKQNKLITTEFQKQ